MKNNITKCKNSIEINKTIYPHINNNLNGNINSNLNSNINSNVIETISSYFIKPSLTFDIKKTNSNKKKKGEYKNDNKTKNFDKNYHKKTLDEQHNEKLNYFKKINEEEIPKLIELKNNPKLIKNSIYNIENLKDINKKIFELKNQEKNYLLKNSKYIFQYFEEKKNISGNNIYNNNIHSFFNLKPNQNNDFLNINSNKKKYENYWKNVNNEILSIEDYIYPIDICNSCNQGELILQEEEGILICNNCSTTISHIIESSKASNKEPLNEVSYTAYIRLNHFKEILSQFQAKETTQIPIEVINTIRDRIKKERIEDVTKIDYNKMREILKKLSLNKYFEHIQYINSLFGIKPPIMNEELHETLCMLFIEIQQPWVIHNPPHRRNFFNYTYTLYQLCVLLDQTQYLPYIPMMKDRDKQLEQDMIWKKVCGELGWKFFPTL